ncbi:MAG: hypothetical protein JXR30_02500 [Alphaproteobacteria bacterium]|nr:hypothetical protein [Alphaproteobacteria bacterium]
MKAFLVASFLMLTTLSIFSPAQAQQQKLRGLYLCPAESISINKLGIKPELFSKINQAVQLLKNVVFGICLIWGLLEIIYVFFGKKEDKDKRVKQVKHVVLVFLLMVGVSVAFNLIAKGELFSTTQQTYVDTRRTTKLFEKCTARSTGAQFVPAQYIKRAR